MAERKTGVAISREALKELFELQSLKQLAEKKRVKCMGEIVEDLLGFKKQLPYYSTGVRRLAGIGSHSEETEKRRQRTIKSKKTKKRK